MNGLTNLFWCFVQGPDPAVDGSANDEMFNFFAGMDKDEDEDDIVENSKEGGDGVVEKDAISLDDMRFDSLDGMQFHSLDDLNQGPPPACKGEEGEEEVVVEVVEKEKGGDKTGKEEEEEKRKKEEE